MFARVLCAAILIVAFSTAAFSKSTPTYKETILHSLNDHNGDANPSGGLLMDASGNLYGTSLSGTLFRLTQDSSGQWNYSVLCDCGDSNSYGFLAMDQSGNLYGSNFWNEIDKFSKGTSGQWSSTLIYAFGGDRGNGPSPLLVDKSGKVYGTYALGGAFNKGFVFELSDSNGSWTLTDIHDFSGTDGALSTLPGKLGGLIMDSAGSLYGTTASGGSSTKCAGGCGVVFKLTNQSGIWKEQVLHSFSGGDGSASAAALLMDATGNLYGTTTSGGPAGFGTVFETYLAGGKWSTRILHNFTNANGDGAFPDATLIMDQSGNLFGTTTAGGGSSECQVGNVYGCGTVFELTQQNGTWKESVLERFSGGGNGGFPEGVLIGHDGKLYGAAQAGGRFFMGLIFELSKM
jgi:uncharacterized repeat protein (TIGR03803 family)